eukprot:1177051-Prorocentrum_minimum.AAC.4
MRRMQSSDHRRSQRGASRRGLGGPGGESVPIRMAGNTLCRLGTNVLQQRQPLGMSLGTNLR